MKIGKCSKKRGMQCRKTKRREKLHPMQRGVGVGERRGIRESVSEGGGLCGASGHG